MQSETMAIVAETCLAAILFIASVVSARSKSTWHSVVRVIGSGLYLVSALVLVCVELFSASALPKWIAKDPMFFVWILICGSLLGSALFTVGYFAQVLAETKRLKGGGP